MSGPEKTPERLQKEEALIREAKRLDLEKLRAMELLRDVQAQRIKLAIQAQELGLDLPVCLPYCCASPNTISAVDLPTERPFRP